MIYIHSVSHAFSGLPVLREASVEIGGGRLIALVGPNGAGKSTLMRCAAGLLHPDSGWVELRQRPITSWSPRQRARLLAFLPQQVTPAFPITVREMVAWGRHPHHGPLGREDRRAGEVVAAAMRRLEVDHLAERSFATLSGGEAQRCLVASCLAQEPRVLLLDEPTAGLDPPHARNLFAYLRELVEEGLAVFTVTHDLNLASLFAHRLVLLAAGRVVAQGEAAEVLQPPLLTEAYGPGLLVTPHAVAPKPVVLPAP